MTYSPDCTICPIVQDPDEREANFRIVEGQYWVATTRVADQEYLGTAYVSLRDHKESLVDLSPEEDNEFIVIRNQLITAQQRAFGASVVNISCLMNNTFQDEVAAPHVHYHFKPRYQNIISFAGEDFIDTQFGHYITTKQPHPVSNKTGRLITKLLQSEIPI